MLSLIDRQLVRGYFKAYFIVLVSLLSLYIVVDLFTNLDDFTGKNKSFDRVLRDISFYYGFKVTHIFDLLSEYIVLLAAVFTMAWMQRNNELLPLLSAGISTRRVVMPVLISAAFMLGLNVVNQEIFIPLLASRLMNDKDDVAGEKEIAVRGAYEPNGVHIEGERARRNELMILDFRCTIPENLTGNLIHLTAKQAVFFPDANGGRGGKWELTGTRPAEVEGLEKGNGVLEQVDTGRFNLAVRETDFDQLTRNPNWFRLASTLRIFQEMQKPEANRLTQVAVMFHFRITRPGLGLILVVLGLGVILRDQNRNVILSAGSCLALCGIFFAISYCCKMLGDSDILTPALAAWLPLIGFGPLALVMFDAVHT
ncbi:MAG: LptF/LptG family permease [Gemmataceae bacterium]|nr:LptF/LptG family permease [Gemmataceae bacterium]